MTKYEERRALTKQLIKQSINGNTFDATKDLKEMIKLTKEIRLEDALANTNI